MINSQVIPYPRQLSSGQKTARNLVFTLLQKLEVGSLTILESFDEEHAKQRTLFGCPKNGTPQAMMFDLIFVAMLIGSILAHELGHAWGALIQNVRVRRIMLHGGGGFILE